MCEVPNPIPSSPKGSMVSAEEASGHPTETLFSVSRRKWQVQTSWERAAASVVHTRVSHEKCLKRGCWHGVPVLEGRPIQIKTKGTPFLKRKHSEERSCKNSPGVDFVAKILRGETRENARPLVNVGPVALFFFGDF